MSKEQEVLSRLFAKFQNSGDPVFTNEDAKKVCSKVGFSNHFDVTKIDHSILLPDKIKNAGYCIAHLGRGKHQFIRALNDWYHKLERIDDDVKEFEYKPSILNHTDTSESNIISMAYNQRIIHHFLYGAVGADFRIYMARRTKFTGAYKVGKINLQVESLQMEMDAIFEKDGCVTVVEGKNIQRDDFSVYQLYHPFLSYINGGIDGIKQVDCCYILKSNVKACYQLDLRLYSFTNQKDLATIHLKKQTRYILVD